MGQHCHRHRTDPAQGWQRGICLYLPPDKKSRWRQVWQTEKGNVWIDAKKTSPYQFYQFWLNASDSDAEQWIKIFTLLPKDQIELLVTTHAEAPHQRLLQKKLAEEVTSFVHSRDDYDFAIKASEILFGNATADALASLNEEQLLQVMEGVPTAEISRAQLSAGYDLVSLLADAKIFSSKGEARKTLAGGGISINKTKVAPDKSTVVPEDLLKDKYLLVQKGKKNYHFIKVV